MVRRRHRGRQRFPGVHRREDTGFVAGAAVCLHESIQPGFVRNEINYALHCGKPILRVNLDDVELTPGMELCLGGMQYVDATEPGGDYLERIVRTLLAERKEKA